MTFREDKSGQVMLTSAFLFAVIIAIIAIMLNNLIFSNNVAYLGFMGQSKYDELSIKQMTTDEAANAFVESNGDPNLFQKYMIDYNKSINSITIQKGRYIRITDMITNGDISNVHATGATNFKLSIYGKDSSKTYHITTDYFKPTPIPLPSARVPGNVIVKIGSNASELSISPPGNMALLIVEVINSSTFMPEPGVSVNVNISAGYLQWRTIGTSGTEHTLAVTTDYDGKAEVYYNYNVVGQQIINASVGTNPSRAYKNLSNNVTITVLSSSVTTGYCTIHPVVVGPEEVTLSTSHHTDYVEIKVPIHIAEPYDFKSSTHPFQVLLTYPLPSNLQLISQSSQYFREISDDNVKSPPANYNNYVWIKLKRLDSSAYSFTLTVTVTANCNIDGGAYSQVVPITINGP